MTQTVDLILYNAGQLCTVPAHGGGPQRGAALGDLGLIEDGAVAVHAGKIAGVGTSARVRAAYAARQQIDAGGRLVTPGLVDPHTHLIWAGDRAGEFEQRLAGATYQEIMAAGGGINRTVRATREASIDELVTAGAARLDAMLAHGTTTVEGKTGYGLVTAAELRMLDALARLDAAHVVDVVPTFLGAHAVPPEFAGRAGAYVDLLVNEMIPAVQFWQAVNRPDPLFCDVFCEAGAFDLAQTRRILEAAARAGMALKVHADEFENLGGVGLGVELGAASVDHIVETSDAEIEAVGRSNTVAVSLPATPFGLAQSKYTPARKFLAAGAALAVATDCNPGTAWCESMQLVMALATRYLRLTQAQALAAATVNAAFAIGRGERVGSLEVGKQADLVIWNVSDYRQLGYRFGVNLVRGVIKAGETVV
ncbi:MAG: imidazolonepropionase [Anaerolineae bacterium]|nr:imidazolonepropionase [Anaerolineae bacterium]